MAEVEQFFPRKEPEWSVGDVLHFESQAELRAFDDTMPNYLDELAISHWRTRPSITEQIRPAKFYGQISQFTLTSIADGITRLRNANTRVHTLSTSRAAGGSILSDFENQSAHPEKLAYGFEYNYTFSSSTGLNGIANGILVYATSLTTPKSGNGQIKRRRESTPYGLRRMLTFPVLIANGDQDQIIEESVQRALAHQRRAVLNPFLGGMPGSKRRT